MLAVVQVVKEVPLCLPQVPVVHKQAEVLALLVVVAAMVPVDPLLF
jgi:hypothetical protein